MEEKTNNEINSKNKGKKVKTIICAVVAIIVVFAGMNVFASVNGYGNIFFMIKNLVTTGSFSGEDEIFSDKEITLSYKSIDVADGVKIQINKLELLENGSNLYLTVKGTNSKQLPLKYTLKSEGLKATDFNGKEQAGNSFEFQEKLSTSYKFSEDELMTLYVKNKKGDTLREIEINLDTREIIVNGETEISKISEVELKKYLGIFSEMNNYLTENDLLLYLAREIQFDIASKEPSLDRETMNNVIKEFYGERGEFEEIKSKKVLKLDTEHADAWKYSEKNDSYSNEFDNVDYRRGICLNINNISYADGIYTVDYIYVLATGYEIDDEKIEELEQYETTIKLKRDEDAEYSKYQIVDIRPGKIVKDRVNNNISEENHEHNYQVVRPVSQSDWETTLDGKHTLKCKICGEEKTEKHNFDKWEELGNNAWALFCPDCGRVVNTNDAKVVRTSGYNVKEKVNQQSTTQPNTQQNHEHNYQVVRPVSQSDWETTLDGKHTLKCTLCGEEKAEKHNFDRWDKIGENAWALFCPDCGRVVNTKDENLVKNSGYKVKGEENQQANTQSNTQSNHEHKYQVVRPVSQSDWETTLDGKHTLKCTLCGEEKTEKHNFDRWDKIGENAWALFCPDCGRVVNTKDENLVKNSGYKVKGEENQQANTQSNTQSNHEHNYQVVKPVIQGETPLKLLNSEHILKCTVCGDEKTEKHKIKKFKVEGDTWAIYCTDCNRVCQTNDENIINNY